MTAELTGTSCGALVGHWPGMVKTEIAGQVVVRLLSERPALGDLVPSVLPLPSYSRLLLSLFRLCSQPKWSGTGCGMHGRHNLGSSFAMEYEM